ncbi:MAG: PadR family transcriptional regulator [Thermoleophilaceae bacterium]
MSHLSPTAYVILGMLARRLMSGYDIKAAVDRSTRFFWAASYGQIYPELRRLAEAGLVEGDAVDAGGRRRTLYSLTAAGRDALAEWLAEPPQAFETRDEGLLKLFFASAAPETAEATLAAKQRHHEATVARLREIEAEGKAQGFGLTVLRYGIECHSWMAGWCERERERR